MSQSDNTVRLISTATMRVEASIHGLRPPPAAAALAAAGYGACCSAAASSPAGVVLQPLSGHVVLPAEHATLQFFDIHRDRHIARLQVGGVGVVWGKGGGRWALDLVNGLAQCWSPVCRYSGSSSSSYTVATLYASTYASKLSFNVDPPCLHSCKQLLDQPFLSTVSEHCSLAVYYVLT